MTTDTGGIGGGGDIGAAFPVSRARGVIQHDMSSLVIGDDDVRGIGARGDIGAAFPVGRGARVRGVIPNAT